MAEKMQNLTGNKSTGHA